MYICTVKQRKNNNMNTHLVVPSIEKYNSIIEGEKTCINASIIVIPSLKYFRTILRVNLNDTFINYQSILNFFQNSLMIYRIFLNLFRIILKFLRRF